MTSRIAVLAAALLGCTGSEPGTTDETGHTGDPTLAPPATAGDCGVETTSATTLTGAREVLTDSYGYGSGVPDGLAAQVFTDTVSFEAWLVAVGMTPTAPVDFATELAVAVTYGPNGTCGLTEEWEAWDVSGTPHVEVRIVDSSFACEEVCDMAAELLIVVAVPRGAASTATVCGRLGGGCGSPP